MKKLALLACLIFSGFVADASIAVENQNRSVSGTRADWICNARSLSGKFYSATGPDQAATQAQAMTLCQAHSFRCYPTGCRH